MSRPFCKQCWGKTMKRSCVEKAQDGEELERADEIVDMIGLSSEKDDHNDDRR